MKEKEIVLVNFFHSDRQIQEGSWVLFLENKSLQILEVAISISRHDVVSIQVVSKHTKYQITFVYRPLKSMAADDVDLNNTLTDVVTIQKWIVIGDFNTPDLD